ncbi:hypothetical protein KGF42_08560 [Clostridioides sp. ZZV15-6383]|uniref:hypothetical protein n=1 Tax=Clostridioides sp. ZZV15-6383 TaxID=2811498 RepID=UPI001D1226FD|nr:hypothetical protein [Clostridioides sp. ZZV15-6383]
MIIVSVITLSSMHYFDKNSRYNPDFNFKKVYICNDKVNKYDIVDDILFSSSYKEIDDDRNYIIFVNEKNKVIKYTGLNKKYQILNSSLRMYSKKNAIFKFEKLRYKDKTVYELK